ncbi:MAG: hypothetical protein ACC618_02500 [Patescibacteria group bacterium]
MKIPFLTVPDKPIVSSTQDDVPVADIVDGIVIYKNGGAALVLESTSLNFGLLSEREQQAVIAAYAALLNSFTFPVQIVVRSQRKDISSYILYLDEAQKKITNPKLAVLMKDYRRFILESIRKKNVLSKNFYLVIPFTPLELGIAKSFLITTRKSGPLPFAKSYVIEKAKVALFPKRDHLMRQAGRLSITLTPLATNELIKLFYNTLNPKPPPQKPEYMQANMKGRK